MAAAHDVEIEEDMNLNMDRELKDELEEVGTGQMEEVEQVFQAGVEKVR